MESAGYIKNLIGNMAHLKYWIKNQEENGYNTHISFFKRPGKDGSGFECDAVALKNVIKSHEKCGNRYYELTAIVFGDVSFQVFYMESFLADNARKCVREHFGSRGQVIYRLSAEG